MVDLSKQSQKITERDYLISTKPQSLLGTTW